MGKWPPVGEVPAVQERLLVFVPNLAFREML